jgi:hypothetical protein
MTGLDYKISLIDGNYFIYRIVMISFFEFYAPDKGSEIVLVTCSEF